MDAYRYHRSKDISSVLIVGHGGGGTTAFLKAMQNLGFLTNSEKDFDTLKHAPSPTVEKHRLESREMIAQFSKAVFIFNDPLHATLSFYRRNFTDQCFKLFPNNPAFGESCLDYSLSGYMQKVASEKRELYGIEHQMRAWTSTAQVLPMDTFFVNFKSILKANKIANKLEDFLDLKQGSLYIPLRKERATEEENDLSISKDEYAVVQHVYHKLYSW
eukprot:CAMPEP_0185254976 /NCGR_PEP_ID=MMETSP1359-20130426/3934_1 /TAXON_ID=552665 /ORGANISM="Bigelowiella longifila, Strain CCMP242" /LENGTH=215 /DNA_ID=CAMNT_0027838503 /DNA_START=138 /DNA_END=782 /DNA_ORIENTATION=+